MENFLILSKGLYDMNKFAIRRFNAVFDDTCGNLIQLYQE